MSVVDWLLRQRNRPPSPAGARTIALTAHGPAPEALSGRLRADTWADSTGQSIYARRVDRHLEFVVPAAITGGAWVTVTADGYKPADVRLVLPDGDTELDAVTLERAAPPRRFPAEHGPLSIIDEHFRDEDGKVWGWRGATMFMLFARFRRGERIDPQIRWMQRVGVNVARVFMAGVNWRPEWYGDFDDFKRPWEHPAYEQQVGDFYDLMADEGLRVESTVCTYAIDTATWRHVLQRVYDVARSRWNVFVEGVNEPWVGHGDPVAIYTGVNRYGVLSAYGLQPEGDGGEGYLFCPALDYCTPHLPRDGHFPHNPKDMLNMRQVLHVPIVDDEPLGVADFKRVGAGARTNELAPVVSHFATARLFGGATFHFEAGLAGLAPLEGSTTDQIAMAVGDMWQAIQDAAPLGVYSAPHLHGFPLAWVNNLDSLVNHAYATLHGDTAWAVNCLPRAGWQAVGRDGWRVVSESGPTCKLER